MQANSTHTAGDGLLLSVIPLLQPKTFPLRCWETVSKRQRSERDGERERRGRETTHLDGNLTSLRDEVIDARIGVLFAVPSPPSLSPSMPGYSRFTVSVQHAASSLPFHFHKKKLRRFNRGFFFVSCEVTTVELQVNWDVATDCMPSSYNVSCVVLKKK